MNKFNKSLIDAAITGLLAVPDDQADINETVYAGSSGGSLKLSGSGCKSVNENKLDSTLYVESGFEGGFEGSFSGFNTGVFFFEMFSFGDTIDGYGPLVSSNKGKTLNQDLTEDGWFDLDETMADYVYGDFNDGCKNVSDYNYGSTMITKFETKLNKKGNKAKLKMDAEASYEDTKGKDKKVKLKVKANMDNID